MTLGIVDKARESRGWDKNCNDDKDAAGSGVSESKDGNCRHGERSWPSQREVDELIDNKECPVE